MQKQRLLWASTGTKNPGNRDTLYIEELVGPETVNTVPPATLDAFRHHGRVRASLEENVDGAGEVIDSLEKFGISLREVTDHLLQDGVASFAKEFEKLLSAVLMQRPVARQNQLARAHQSGEGCDDGSGGKESDTNGRQLSGWGSSRGPAQFGPRVVGF